MSSKVSDQDNDTFGFEAEPMEGEILPMRVVDGMNVENNLVVYRQLVDFVQRVLTPEVDYGLVPGTGKPSMFKPGAEKLRRFFSLYTETTLSDKVEEWHSEINPKEFPLFTYDYVTYIKNDSGLMIATCEGNANSYEDKYRWRWVNYLPEMWEKYLNDVVMESSSESEFDFAIKKAETSGKYGKPQAYWDSWQEDIANGKAKQIQRKSGSGTEYPAWEREGVRYRVPNENIFTQVNTLKKMAQKRSFVGAILLATGASEFFTQDIEDYAKQYAPEEVSVRTFVPDKTTASRKLISYVRSKGIDDAGNFIKALLEEKNITFSLDEWNEVLDLVDAKIGETV